MSDLNSITCPDCGCIIPISEALSHQAEENLKVAFDAKVKDLELQKSKILENQEKMQQEADERVKKTEEGLKERMRLDLLAQREKIKEDVSKEAREKVSLELEDLKKQNLD